jgi:RNA polymerase sigma-70 factor (ECF subfamily)
MKNAPDAKDAVADVFVKLIKKGVAFESEEHEKAWLLRTAINHCKNNLKHWWRRSSNIDDHRNLESEPLKDNHVLEIVLALPERYKDVIYLYYYEGYATAEIAEILNKPHSTVRNQMSEARHLLKEILEDEE